MRSNFPHRLALRLTTDEAQMLSELKGFRYCWEPSSIVRQAIREQHARMVSESGGSNPTLDLMFAPELRKPSLSDEKPAASDNVEVKAEPSGGVRKSKRRAKDPKPSDNHKPKKGASNAAKRGSNGGTVQRKKGARARRPGKAKAGSEGKQDVGAAV